MSNIGVGILTKMASSANTCKNPETFINTLSMTYQDYLTAIEEHKESEKMKKDQNLIPSVDEIKNEVNSMFNRNADSYISEQELETSIQQNEGISNFNGNAFVREMEKRRQEMKKM